MQKNLFLRNKKTFSHEGLSLMEVFPAKTQTLIPKTTLTQR